MRDAADPIRPVANGLWGLLCVPDALRFRHAIGSGKTVRAAQESLLLSLVRRNRDTAYGRRYGFAGIRSVADFQRNVPLVEYEDVADAVARVGAGHERELTAERVRLLEPTSGSSAATKHIPYTATLKREFGRAIAPWIVDLFLSDPRLLFGQAYWSVTPVARRDARTPAGLPIGFEEDAEYLGPLQRRLVAATMAVPPDVKRLAHIETFRYATLLFLLRSRALALISVWNPTFLTILVERLPEWWPRLAEDIERGALSCPDARPEDDAARAALRRLESHCAADPRRAAEVRWACAGVEWGKDAGAAHRRLWPRLRVISCWADAQAAPYAAQVQRLFPHARLQPKGLIATEGIVSVPVEKLGRGPRTEQLPGSVLAVRSHFFEFLPQDGPAGDGRPLLADELETGGRYEVVLTTGGGLYRYRLRDLVEITGHTTAGGGCRGGCPVLRFIGRDAHQSDWFGEKLDERHVRGALEGVLAVLGVQPTFAMLACERPEPVGDDVTGGNLPDTKGPVYALFVEAPDEPDAALVTAGEELERALLENYHYRYCRDLGQLAPLRVFRIEEGAQHAYLSECQRQGMRAGDVKPTALHRQDGWSRVFRGGFLAARGAVSGE